MKVEGAGFQGVVLIQDKGTPIDFYHCTFHNGLRVYNEEETALQLLATQMELESYRKRLKLIEEEGL